MHWTFLPSTRQRIKFAITPTSPAEPVRLRISGLYAHAVAQDQAAERRWASLLLYLCIPYAAGLIGHFALVEGVQGWYGALVAPTWRAPAWLFTLGATIANGGLGLAFWGGAPRSRQWALLLAICLLIALWPYLFFTWRLSILAAASAFALCLLTLFAMRCFPRPWWLIALAAMSLVQVAHSLAVR